MRLIALASLVFLFTAIFLLYPQNDVSGPIGIVIPHHDMVAETRAAYLSKVSDRIKPKTIVVMSPDHFDAVSGTIAASDRLWETSVGEIIPDTDLIQRLQISVQNEPFLSEHGITSLVKEIKQFFPSSKIVPVLINRSATYEEVILLTRSLYSECPDCFLVSSVDFSHTNDAMVADLHDTLTMRELFDADSEALYKEAEVDSPESLVALTTWAKLHNHNKFELFSHTNSGFLSDARSGEMTTHIIGGYYAGESDYEESVVTFMATGDLSLSRGVHNQIQKQSGLLDKLGERFFWGVDVSLVNLEGYFSNDFDQAVWEQEPPLFPISKENVKYLDFLRVNTVNLANNHTRDGGDAGFQNTLSVLKDNNIEVIGDHSDISEASVRVEQIGDVKVAFIGVYTHQPFSNLVEAIQKLSESGHHVVVYAHWGEEFNTLSNTVQQAMARDWIDAGADLVIGSHPHVVQDFELYQDRPIIYSLGNFIFDQNFSEDVQTGAVIGGKFERDSVSLFVSPVNSYLEPYVIENNKYKGYVENWTKNWSSNLQDDGYFTFDLQ